MQANSPRPQQERDRTVVRLLPLVRGVVRRMRLPPGSIDDCVQEGLVGLLRRFDAYDPARGSLETWVPSTVRFAVQDYLRLHGDSVVRVGRIEARRRKAAGLDVRHLCVSLHDGGEEGALARTATRGIASPQESHTAVVERRDLVAHAVARISSRERQVIDLLYPRDGGASVALTQAGRRLGISPSRVAQIRGAALRTMRENRTREAQPRESRNKERLEAAHPPPGAFSRFRPDSCFL
ncbi:MAG: sigma-70 family RNA polymerase sigma factor [Planctomycetaceae bacterium]